MPTITPQPRPEIGALLQKQQRNATLLLFILGAVYLAAALLYGVIYQQQPAWQFAVLIGLSITLGLAALWGVWLSGRGRPHQGVLLYLPVAWLLFPLGAYFVANVGLIYGVSMLLGSAPVVFNTLPRRTAWWTLLPAAVSGVAAILLDYFGPAGRPGVPELSASLTVLATVAVTILMAVGGGIALVRNINNVSLAGKFVIVAALFTLPLMVAVGLLVLTQSDRIDRYGNREKYGTQYLRPLQGLLAEAARYEWLTVEQAATVDRAALTRSQQQMDDYFRQAAQLDAAYGRILQSTAALQDLQAEWEAIRAADLSATAESRRAQQRSFTTNLRAVIALVGDTSYLILDPDIATYYLMDSILLAHPEQEAAISRLLNLNAEMIGEQPPTLEEQAEMIIVAEQLKAGIARLQRNLDTATGRQGAVYEQLAGPLADLYMAVSDNRLLLQRRIGTALGVKISSGAYRAAADRLRWASDANYRATSRALEAGIEERIRAATGQMWATVGLALSAETLAIAVGYFIIRAISRPMRALTQATGQLAGGDLKARVTVRNRDEVGRLGLAFNEMAERLQASQADLAERNRALAASAEVSRRLSTVLDETQLVREVVDEVQRAFGFYHVHIYLFDGPREHLVMAGGTGPAGAALLARGHRLPRGLGLVGRAAETNSPVFVPQTDLDPGWMPNPLLPETQAEVAVPLAVGGEVLGVLDVQHSVAGGLHPSDVDTLQSIGNQVAVALRNARSYARVQREAEREARLNDINRKIQSAVSLEAVLETATRELGQALRARSATAEINLRNGAAQPKAAPTHGRATNGHPEN